MVSESFSIRLSGGKLPATLSFEDFKEAVEALNPSYARSFLTFTMAQPISEDTSRNLNAVLDPDSSLGSTLIDDWVSKNSPHLRALSQSFCPPMGSEENHEEVDILNRRRALKWALGASLAGVTGAVARVSGNTSIALLLEPSAICVTAGCLKDYNKAQQFLSAVAGLNRRISESHFRLHGEELTVPPSLPGVSDHQGRSR